MSMAIEANTESLHEIRNSDKNRQKYATLANNIGKLYLETLPDEK